VSARFFMFVKSLQMVGTDRERGCIDVGDL